MKHQQLTFTREAVAVQPRAAVILDDLCMALHCTRFNRQAVADRINAKWTGRAHWRQSRGCP